MWSAARPTTRPRQRRAISRDTSQGFRTEADGTITVVDMTTDREAPVWYMVVATTTTQGA